LALLRRFAVEAAREEARLFCDDLVAEACIIQADQSYADAQLVAAYLVLRDFYPGMIEGALRCSRTIPSAALP
jgi:hypothetical protein